MRDNERIRKSTRHTATGSREAHAVTGTVELVIAGDGSRARAAAVGALRRGERVLLVMRSGDARAARRLRRNIVGGAGLRAGDLHIMTRAEVVCVDGVNGVEAVVIRHGPTGRLSAVNASAFLSSDASGKNDSSGSHLLVFQRAHRIHS
jgi:thioredoxin reductase